MRLRGMLLLLGVALRRGGLRHGLDVEQGVELLVLDPGEEVPVGLDPVAARQGLELAPVHVFRTQVEEVPHALGGVRQDRAQHDGGIPEEGQCRGADALQALAFGRDLGQVPGLLLVDVLVDLVQQVPDLPDGLAELTIRVQQADGVPAAFVALELLSQRLRGGVQRGDRAAETLGQEARAAAGDVDVLAHEVAVHPRHEILGVEVDVLHRGVQLGGDVVAQPLRVHAEVQVAQRIDAGAARLGHLLARDADEAVHEDVVGHLVRRAGEVQHRRPEQGVEVDDVLADEMDLLVPGQHLLPVEPLLAAVVLQAGEVADRRVEPDVEVLLLGDVGHADAEIGRVARDVPVAERLVALAVEPLDGLVEHLRLDAAGGREPFADEVLALRVGQAEEEVLRGAQLGPGPGERGVRVLQRGGGVDRAAVLAGVAVLVLRAAARALALHVAVGEVHALHRVVELLDRPGVDQAGLLEPPEDVLRALGVLRRMRRMPVVVRDVEAVEVALAARGDAGDERLRGLARLLRRQHDRRAVRVVGADEMHLVPLHALEPHPDVGLDVLHDVADVERAVGVGQGGGDKELAGHALLGENHEFSLRRACARPARGCCPGSARVPCEAPPWPGLRPESIMNRCLAFGQSRHFISVAAAVSVAGAARQEHRRSPLDPLRRDRAPRADTRAGCLPRLHRSVPRGRRLPCAPCRRVAGSTAAFAAGSARRSPAPPRSRCRPAGS